MINVLAIIGIIIIIFSMVTICAAICISVQHTPEEDEYQIEYTKQWFEKKKTKKQKKIIISEGGI